MWQLVVIWSRWGDFVRCLDACLILRSDRRAVELVRVCGDPGGFGALWVVRPVAAYGPGAAWVTVLDGAGACLGLILGLSSLKGLPPFPPFHSGLCRWLSNLGVFRDDALTYL